MRAALWAGEKAGERVAPWVGLKGVGLAEKLVAG
jgi:hypothetical protein